MSSSCGTVTAKNVAIAALAAGAIYFVGRKLGLFGCGKSSVASPQAPVAAGDKVNAIVISGPSGVGKGTLIDRVKKEYPDAFAVSVSHTSRAPRPNEVNGTHYHFSTKDEMLAMEQRGEFVEMCTVHGNCYGTSMAALDAVRKSGKVCIIECDVQGSQKIKASFAKAKSDLKVAYMFIAAPSMSELEARITSRGGETPDKVQTRLVTAKAEMTFVETNKGHFDFVLYNDVLDAAYARFVAFLQRKGALPTAQ